MSASSMPEGGLGGVGGVRRTGSGGGTMVSAGRVWPEPFPRLRVWGDVARVGGSSRTGAGCSA